MSCGQMLGIRTPSLTLRRSVSCGRSGCVFDCLLRDERKKFVANERHIAGVYNGNQRIRTSDLHRFLLLHSHEVTQVYGSSTD